MGIASSGDTLALCGGAISAQYSMQLKARIIIGTCAWFTHCMKKPILSMLLLPLALALSVQAGTPARQD